MLLQIDRYCVSKQVILSFPGTVFKRGTKYLFVRRKCSVGRKKDRGALKVGKFCWEYLIWIMQCIMNDWMSKKWSHPWFMFSFKNSWLLPVLTKDMSRTVFFLWQWLQKKAFRKEANNRWMLALHYRLFGHLRQGFVDWIFYLEGSNIPMFPVLVTW